MALFENVRFSKLLRRTNFRKPTLSTARKWGKYKLTAPVKRADIVKSYFINQLIWLFVGMIFAGVGPGLSWLLYGCPFDQNIDALTAWIVRRIFEWAKNGSGPNRIRRRLEDEEIPCPAWWNRQKGLRDHVTKFERENPERGRFIWDFTAIQGILANPVYIGAIASQKVNYRFKIGWMGDKKREDWIIVEGMHEAIIDRDTYDIVQEKVKSRKCPDAWGNFSLFAGLVKCGQCGSTLNIRRANQKGNERIYTCSRYNKYGVAHCSQHRIRYDTLYNIVLEQIRAYARKALADEQEAAAQLRENCQADEQAEREAIQRSIDEDSERITALERIISRVYEDMIAQRISEDNFNRILENSQTEQATLKNRVMLNRERLAQQTQEQEDSTRWLEIIKDYSALPGRYREDSSPIPLCFPSLRARCPPNAPGAARKMYAASRPGLCTLSLPCLPASPLLPFLCPPFHKNNSRISVIRLSIFILQLAPPPLFAKTPYLFSKNFGILSSYVQPSPQTKHRRKKQGPAQNSPAPQGGIFMAKPLVAIVGRPNVGKSMLFNKLTGKRLSIVEDTPGVTRDRLYAQAEWRGRTFDLVDTGGIEPGTDNQILSFMREQAEIAIAAATVIVFVCDIRTGMTAADQEVAGMLQRSRKPVVLAVNKMDSTGHTNPDIYEFYNLGLGDPYPVSAVHGHGTGDLLDACFEHFPPEDQAEAEDDVIKVAIIGKPNVGKSSLVNRILGQERVIVSDVAGTTRDAVDSYFEKDGQKYLIIDTAGMRKKSKVDDRVEKFSVLRATMAIERSDVCAIMIDAQEGVTEQDTKVAGLAHDAGKACIIVVNKWDAIEKDGKTMQRMEEDVRRDLSYMTYAPVLFLSALTGQRVEKLFGLIDSVVNQAAMRIPTGVLNQVLADAQARVQPPTDKGKRLKIYYMTQIGVKPPHFVIFCNDAQLFHFSYRRYLENQIRATFGLTGTPVRITIRQKGDKEES